MVEHLVQAAELGGAHVGCVPSVGAARGDLQCAPFAQAADPNGQPRLHRPRQAGSVVRLKVLAGEGDALFREHPPDDRRGLVEHVEAGAHVREGIAVSRRLPDVPAGAQAELEAPAGDVIQRGGGLGEQGRVAVSHVEDEATDAGVAGFRGQCAQRGEGLEVWLRAALRWRLVEVVPSRNPIHFGGIQLAPHGTQLGHGQVLLTNVNAERQGHVRSLDSYLDGGSVTEGAP